MTKLNPLFLNDVYKHGHADFYNPKTTKIYSTFTPRKSRVNGVDKVVVFGLQYLVKKYLIEDFNDNFFNKPEEEVVKDYLKIINNITGNNGIGEERIRKLHQLGYLPVKICSLEEGELCPVKVPMLTIENTLPEFYWVTNFLETLICNTLWMPCTSATTSLQYRKVLDKWAEKTCDNNDHVDYQAHDFSLRSMSCMEAGTISGLAHLLNFKGTDTIPSVICAEQYYNSNSDIEDIGHSINATEHSVQETNILFNNYENKEEGEYLNLLQILEQMGPESNFSYVADTYNLWDCITKVLPRLKDEILGRKGKLVIRPDSGDPCDIICGINTKTFFDPYRGIEKPEKLLTEKDSEYYEHINKGVIEILWDIFGGTINSKGYKVLNPHIGCIYGDGITLERAEEICTRLEAKGFASSNIVFGIGGYSFQYVTRDTFGFALKTTYGEVDNKELLLFKDPITDDGEKKSQKGLVLVCKDNDDNIVYLDELTQEFKQRLHNMDLLKTLFIDGKLVRETSLAEIRNRLTQV